MSDNPSFGKKIVSKTYYQDEEVSSIEELEVDQFSNTENLLKDVIDSLAVVTTGKSKKVTLEVCLDKQNRYRIRKRYTIA